MLLVICKLNQWPYFVQATDITTCMYPYGTKNISKCVFFEIYPYPTYYFVN